MKRILCLLLSVVLLFCGCSNMLTPPKSTAGTAVPTESTGTDTLPQDTTPADTEPGITIQTGNVTVNEVMPDNKKLCMGHELDWVELYNAEEYAISLDGYYLTDDPEKLSEMPLSGMEIPAEGYLVITLDDSAPFRLAGTGETVYLVCDGSIISELSFPAEEHGESFDTSGICTYPTPGFANTEDGYLAYLQTLTLPELIISEVMSSNSKYLPFKGVYYDLLEVYNNSDHAINLSEYTLSDKRSEPARYTFPDVTLQPGEYYVVYCSGSPSLGEAHTSFKLSASGESVYLSKNGTFTDVLTIPADLQKNESYGRCGNIPMYLATPTFGKENSTGHLTGVASPASSLASGVYDEAVTITLSGDGDIYYTLDGSHPTTSSARYQEPITIDGVTTVRTFCVSGDRTSALASYTYIVGAEHDLPIAVVSIPQEYLSGSKGVLNNIDKDYEYEAVLTLIEDGEEKFSIPFGFRLHGNGSRECDKQNFQLRFRSEYGAGKLNYALFDNRDIDEFNSLLLKGGSEDWNVSLIRDELCTAMADGTTNLYTQASKPVVLYLGDEYWGVYFLRERFNDDYVASHLNVSAESVDILFSSAASVQCGSSKDFLALRNYCSKNDMSLDENYEYLCSQIDVLSLMDWYICRSYVGDKDIANIRRFRSSESDSLWRWMYFDLDWSFYLTTDKALSGIVERNGADKILIKAVLANATGRDTFLKRYAELMDTILNEEYIIGLIDSLSAQIDSEMERDRERWGYSYSYWTKKVQSLRNYVADGARTKNVLKNLKDYFDLTDEEMTYYFG